MPSLVILVLLVLVSILQLPNFVSPTLGTSGRTMCPDLVRPLELHTYDLHHLSPKLSFKIPLGLPEGLNGPGNSAAALLSEDGGARRVSLGHQSHVPAFLPSRQQKAPR